MRLEVKGHPLHTRALSVALAARADAKCDVVASILDLRKRGFVPVAGDLQTSGIVHHMRLTGAVDPRTRTLENVEAAQPNVAFEPSALSRGESCRDPIGRIAEIGGAVLDADFSRRASAAIGGPRGCSHLLTLAHLLGSTVAWALDREGAIGDQPPARRPGERLFRRDVVLDGHEPGERRLEVAVQLTDVHFAPALPIARPMERFAAELEVRLLAEVETERFTLLALTGAERSRTSSDLDEAVWRTLERRTAGFAGLSLLSGFAPRLIERLGEPTDAPLRDALLMLAPALIQIIAAMSESWPSEAVRNPSLMGTGGMPDSCYMWRREGALSATLKDELKTGTLKSRR